MNEPRRRHADGPPAGVLAVVSTALTVLGLILAAILAGGRSFPSPYAGAPDLPAYFTANGSAARVLGTCLFAASVPLGIYAATMYARLLRLGVRVPGPGIGYFGGISAAVMLALSGLTTWTAGQPGVARTESVTAALGFLGFATGGIGFVGGLGLLIAGIAVPSLILRLLPRWLAWAGLIVAALSELSFIALLLTPVGVLLPLGRFAGLVWLIAAGFLLPHTRHEVRRP